MKPPKRCRQKPLSATVEPLEARIAPATILVLNNSDSGAGSLRQAILDANSGAFPGPDVISFASIPGSGAFVIQPLSPLPQITEALFIDGYTAPGTAVNTANIGTNAVLRVEIDASLQGSVGAVLTLGGSGGSTVTGLVIRGTTSAINGNGHGVSIESDDNLVVGNFIGTDVTGTLDFGNNNAQVSVGLFSGADVFTGNRIGGTALADRNILSGGALGVALTDDSVGTVIQGNLIGTDRTGNIAIPNINTGIGGRAIDTLIGGSAPGAGNVISGNDGWGINFAGVNTTIQGNIIGLNAAGDAPLPNSRSGINFSNGAITALVGGSNAGEGNVISGNDGEGIEIGSSFGDGSGDNITVLGNKIGTDATGTLAFGNGVSGIGVYGTSGAQIGGPNPGEGNVIVFNGGAGVLLLELAGSVSGVRISGNGIHSNDGLGIDLVGGAEDSFGVTANDGLDVDFGPNGLLNFPFINDVINTGANVRLDASVEAAPNTDYTVEFFALAPSQIDDSTYGEGALFLGSKLVTTDAFGFANVVFDEMLVLPVNSYFSAVLIDSTTGDTSEFSAVGGPPPITYTWTGAQSQDWFNPLNWSPNGVPSVLDSAIVDGSAINDPRLDAATSIAGYEQSGRTLLGTGVLTVVSSLNWTGGTHAGPTLVLQTGATGTLNSSLGPLQWLTGDFEIRGALTVSGAGLAFNSGDFFVEADGAVTLDTGIFDQDGSGTLSTVTNFGQIGKFSPGTFGLATTRVENFGLILSRAGELVLGDFIGESLSQLILNGGDVSSATPITLNFDAELRGFGSIVGSVNSLGGYVYPGIGEMPGTLTITGNYAQDSSSTFVVDLRGNQPGTGYDQLIVGGTADLDGVLIATILPGYAPTLGDTLNVVSSTSLIGSFDFTVGIGALTPNYTPTAAQLVRNGQLFTWTAGFTADPDNWFQPGNWDLNAVPTAADAALLNNAGLTINLADGDATVGDFIQTAGTLTGPNSLITTGSLVWSGGIQSGAGVTRVQSDASTVLNGGVKTLDGRTLFVQGSGFTDASSQLILDNDALVQIAGLFAVQGNTPFQAGSLGGTIETRPEGTVRKTGGADTMLPAGITFTHNGLLDVQTGTFTILGDGAADDAIFRIGAPTAALIFDSAAGFDLANSVLFEGVGNVILAGGSLAGSDAFVTVTEGITFQINGGTISAANHTFVFDGALVWNGGSLTGDGMAFINAAFDLAGAAPKTLSQWVLNLTPSPMKIWTGTGDLSLEQNAVLNIGSPLRNQGALDILDGGTGGMVFVQFTGSFLVDSGTTTSIGVPFVNDGLVEIDAGGTLQATAGYTQPFGVLALFSGSTLSSPTPVQVQGGLIYGTGMIAATVNNVGGIISPGPTDGGTGALTITGDYAQGSMGELVIEALGNTAVAEYDQLQVGGAAQLDGTLTFVPINLFNPIAPSTFNVLTSTGARTGTFATTNLSPGGSAAYVANGADVVFATAGGIVVTTVNDSGPGSLRQAILDANATPGVDTITFNIPGGSGPRVIQPLTLLPVFTEGVIIDGYSQPSASANTQTIGSDAVLRIVLDGSMVPDLAGPESGLVFTAGASTVQGLIINSWNSYAIELLDADGSVVSGNWIGLDQEGQPVVGNNQFGIWLNDTDGARIGGTAPADRNVISGNFGIGIEISNTSPNTLIQGNYIGTTTDGMGALPNGFDGIYTQGGNTQIGGTSAGAGNVISGSLNSAGVVINLATAAGSKVEGNFIGTDATGTVALGNADFGISVVGTSNVTIGGSTAAAGNVIAGSGFAGIGIEGVGSTGAIVRGNFIGTDVSGTAALGNGGGIYVDSAPGVIVGGLGAGEGNRIARNLDAGILVVGAAGVAIRGNTLTQNSGAGIILENAGGAILEGNFIGTDLNDGNLGNLQQGIYVQGGSATIGGTAPGAGNTIAFNGTSGVVVHSLSTGVAIRGNSIHSNTGLGIDLLAVGSPLAGDGVTPNDPLDADNGGNRLQNFPVLTSATQSAGVGANVSGTLHSTPSTDFLVDFYASNAADPSGFGEGRVFLGDISFSTNPSGDAAFNFNPGALTPGMFITAVATNQSTGDSSEFSAVQSVTGVFVWDNDSGDGNWFDPINWDLDSGVPGPGDTAILNIASTITLTAPVVVGTFVQTDGTLGGAFDFTTTTSHTWSGGTLSGAATLFIPGGATLTLSGAGVKTLDRRFIDNDGTVEVTGIGNLSLLNGPMIFNHGLWDFQSDADIAQSDAIGSLFQNFSGATLRKSAGNIAGGTIIGTGSPNLSFIHASDLDVQAGNLSIFSSGGTWTSGSNLIVASGSKLSFNGGNFLWAEVPGLTGDGTLEINNGTIDLGNGGTLLVGVNFTLAQTGGTITGDGALAVGGTFDWSGGTLSGTGATTIFAGATWNLTTSTSATLDGRAVAMGGTANFTGSGTVFLNNSASISNNVGTFLIAGDGDLAASAGTSTFTNQLGAVFRKTGGSADTDIGSASPTAAVNFTNAGTVEVQAGRLFFHDAFTQSAGTTLFSGGAIATDSTLTLNGGELSGAGLITGSVDNTGATVRPAGTGMEGKITITGNYTQGAGGTLAVELNGTSPEEFDSLDVGTATLGGTLNIANLAGFTPSGGDMFRVVLSGNNPGTFTTLTGATAGISQTADATGLVISVAAAGETDVSLSGGNLVITDINGGTSDDTLTITLVGANVRVSDPANTLVAGAGATQVDANTVEVPLASITGSIQVNTLGGTDTLTLALAGGDFIVAGGLVFAGDTGSDTLIITGGAQGTVTYNFTNANDGSVVMSNFGTVSFTGLEFATNSGGASDVIFDLPTAASAATLGDDGTGGNALSRLSGATFVQTDFANPSGSLTINAGNAADTLTVNALPDFNASLTIGSAANPIGMLTFAGAVALAADRNLTADASGTILLSTTNSDLATSGTGATSLTTLRNISLTSGSSVTTVNGNLTLSANAAGTGTGDFAGVAVSSALVQATGTGIVSVTGRGGDAAGGLQFGISLGGTGSIIGGTTGTVLISGTGGASAGNSNSGVSMSSGGTMISSSGANIQITGQGGGTGASTSNNGVTANGTISAGGSGGMTISATGGSTTGNGNIGMFFGGGGLVTTAGGNVMVTAQGGGSGTSFSNFGISMINSNTLTAGGTGTVTVSGTGGAASGNSNIGVSIQGTSVITSSGGNVTVTGTGGGTGASTNNLGVFTFNSGSIGTGGSGALELTGIGGANTAATGISLSASTGSISTSGGGDLTLVADGVSFTSGTATAGAGTVTIRPFTAGRAVDLGGADVAGSTLGLTDTELDRITASALLIGNATSGAITISAGITHANNLSLITGAGVSGAGALTLAAGRNLGITANGGINLGGTISVPGTTTLAAGAANDITLTDAGNALATVIITSGATVSLRDDGGFDLGATNVSTLLSVESAGAITQSGALTGTGGLTKLGLGTLTLSLANGYTGTTNVSAGTLNLTGSIADGAAATDVTVNASAFLSGNGTIAGSVLNNGTVQPGGTGVANTLTISGSYTQGAGGTLQAELGGTGAGQFDVLATGSATLDGTINLAHISGFTPSAGQTFRVVTSSGNPGTFASLTGATAGKSQAADAAGLVISQGALTFVWDNSAGNGDWFNPLNWDLDSGVPGAADTAILNIASTINLSADTSVGVFQQSAGTFTSGAGVTFTVLNNFAWTAGTQSGSGTTTVEAGGTLTISGAGFKSLTTRALINNGTANVSGLGVSTTNATVTNNGIFNVTDDADFAGSGSGGFTNSATGALNKTGAGTTSQFYVFSNAGTINATSGTLNFGNGFTQTAGSTVLGGGSITGAFAFNFNAGELSGTGSIGGGNTIVNNGAIFRPGGTGAAGTLTITGFYNHNAGARLEIEVGGTGAGQFDVLAVTNNASLIGPMVASYLGGFTPGTTDTFAVLTAANRLGNFQFVNGPLVPQYNPANVTLVVPAAGQFVWDAGAVADTSWFNPLNWSPDGIPGATDSATLGLNATTTLPGDHSVGSLLKSTGTFTIPTGVTLTVLTEFRWTGGTEDGPGALTVAPGGAFNFPDGADTFLTERTLNLQGTSTFSNATNETMTLANGATINNSGAMEIRGAGILSFNGFAGAGTINNLSAGMLSKTTNNNTVILGVNIPFTNAGTVRSEVGGLQFSGGATQTAGSTQLAGGTVSVPGGLQLNGGEVTGVGAFSGDINNNGGVVRPGGMGTTGTLTTNATYRQFAGGTIELEVAGAGAGEFDVFAPAGLAVLGGTLNAPLLGGFTPGTGSSFRVLDPGSSVIGTFATVNSPLTAQYNVGDVTLLGPVGPLTFVWDNTAGNGDWFNPLNWDRDSGVPGTADTAILNIASTIVLSAPTTVGVFNQSAGTFNGSMLTLASGGNWTGGTVSGGIAVGAGAAFAISGASGKNLFSPGGITIAGTATLTGGDIAVNSSGFTIQSGGLLDVQGDTSIAHTGGGGSGINNQGTLRKSGGTGTSNINTTDFTNAGLIDVQTGTLSFNNPGFSLPFDGLAGSTVNAEAGATALFVSVARFADASFTGAGAKSFTGSNLTLTGNIAAGGFAIASGNWGGTSSITGTLNWTAGNLFGTPTIAPGATLSMSGSATKAIVGSGGVNGIINQGTVTLSGAGSFNPENGGYFDNRAGALFDIQSDAALVQLGGGVSSLINAGTVRKSGGSGTTNVTLGAFSNTGLVDVQSGTLAFAGSVSTGTAGGPNGTFDADSGAAITFTGDTTFTNTTFTGAGTQTYTGSNLTLTGNIAAGGFTIASGNWGGTSSITGTLNWTAGSLIGTPTIAAGGTLNLSGAGLKFISGAGGSVGFVNQGTMVWSGAGNFQIENGGFVDNQVGATFEVRADAAMIQTGGGVSNFINAGTFSRNTGTGTANVSLGNFTTSGTVSVESGTLNFGSFSQTAGATVLAGGTLSTGNTITFGAGELRGSGTITGAVDNTGATVRPGGTGAAGTIAITGGYTQGAGGMLEIELGGTSAGQFDVLDVGGAATLGGTLVVTTIGGLAITPPMSFAVVPYGSRTGTFTSSVPPGLVEDYQTGALVLTTPVMLDPLVVNTTLDVVDAMDSFTSLREAIIFANGNAGLDTITFAIPGTGVQTIAPTSALPAITDAVIIDGYSQPGASANTLAAGNNAVLRIELSGSNSGAGANGLQLGVGSDGSTILGLTINNFSRAGVLVQSDGNIITGNFIGTNTAGSAALPNARHGIDITNGHDNRIGGSTPADRNLISGNLQGGFDGYGIILSDSERTFIQGNFIGTDASGLVSLGQQLTGIGLFGASPDTQIGGIVAVPGTGPGNLISGNSGYGILVNDDPSNDTVIRGNLIGVDITGTAALGNGIGQSDGAGISLYGGGAGITGTIIGGSAAGAGNVIAGNEHGIYFGQRAIATLIQGNAIGLDLGSGSGLGNLSDGILFDTADSTAAIGGTGANEGNLIAFNGGDGVSIAGSSRGILILGNSIHGNLGLGIDLGADGITPNDATDSDTGANDLLNFPLLASATPGTGGVDVAGSVTTAVTGTVRIEFFIADADGEGMTFAGFADVVTTAGGEATFTAGLAGTFDPGDRIVATTSDLSVGGAGTSEFSAAVTVIPPALVSIGDAVIVEGDSGTKQIVFTVTLDMAVPTTVTVNFGTASFSNDARAASGEADYAPTFGTVTFAPNETTQTIAIGIVTNTTPEPTERFNVVLSNAVGAGIGKGTGTGTIIDDDHDTFAVGTGNGNSFSVFTATPAGATLVQTVGEVFRPGFKGGVRIAVGDVNGDGIDDFIAGAGLGGRGKVRVFDGATFAPMAGVLGEFSAFGSTYRGGVFVAAGDVNGDGFEDIIVTPSAGSTNQVRIFSGADGSLLNAFRAFGSGAGGVRVATGDVNGDGFADIIVGTGVGSSVRVFDAMSGSLLDGFRAFAKNYRGGVYVAAGDLNADGIDDIIVGAGAGTPNVRTYLQGVDDAPPVTFQAYTGNALRGVRVTALDIDGDGIADIIASKSRRGDNLVKAFDGGTRASLFDLRAFTTQLDSLYVG